ncbi:hypothetical protein BDF20DRAFT_28365 [Mycotypha africana]|uniref:uncharacterized protein n=1 Tax=Mycotypha africana TaxID=64632 RepID=UPI0023008685|nr:uncharacterized protein BDF20DRAFT_28365 [Mycotypha africana]KAI8991178.1 hypothetical protein BDF20DRAFT_28365 [Mycotypha africana]
MQRTSDILTTDSTLQEQELMDVSVSTQKDTLPLSSSPSSSSSSSTATTAAALAVEHEAFQSQQMLDPASLNIEQRHDDVRTTHEESDSVRLQTELTTNESQDNVNPIPVDDIKSDHGPKASGTARVDSMAKAAVVMMPQESRTIQQSAQSAQKQHLPPMTLVPVPRSSSLMSTSTTAFPATALPRTPLYPKKVDENSSKRQKDAAQQPCTEALVRNTVSEVEATAITASPSHPMSLVSQYASPTERAAMLDDQNILDTHTHSDNKQKTSLIASAQHLLLNDKTFIDEFTEKLSFIKKNIAIMNVHPSKNNKMESSADDQGRAVSSHHFNESLATVSSYSISNQDALEGDNDRYQQQSHHDENGPLSAFHEEEEEEEEEEDHTNIDEELIELSKKVVHNVRTLGEGLKTNGFRIFNNLSTRLKTLQKEYINNHPELNENNIAI